MGWCQQWLQIWDLIEWGFLGPTLWDYFPVLAATQSITLFSWIYTETKLLHVRNAQVYLGTGQRLGNPSDQGNFILADIQINSLCEIKKCKM